MYKKPVRLPQEAKNLKDYRRRLGLTQQEVNSALALPYGTISRYECGYQRVPDYIAIALGNMEPTEDFNTTFRRKCVYFLLSTALHAASSRGLLRISFSEATDLAYKLSHKIS